MARGDLGAPGRVVQAAPTRSEGGRERTVEAAAPIHVLPVLAPGALRHARKVGVQVLLVLGRGELAEAHGLHQQLLLVQRLRGLLDAVLRPVGPEGDARAEAAGAAAAVTAARLAPALRPSVGPAVVPVKGDRDYTHHPSDNGRPAYACHPAYNGPPHLASRLAADSARRRSRECQGGRRGRGSPGSGALADRLTHRSGRRGHSGRRRPRGNPPGERHGTGRGGRSGRLPTSSRGENMAGARHCEIASLPPSQGR
ncbi:uncharacterized protein BcabD6B2_12750 [Babesia caballi]|uniref:Uncharacterized protein n=1 Tax=Babesia caballi TaxID=5871 RepID=A0AAV4LPG2_BABCB|nr:hypothetical protein BcabD6B2_12750 [Babesia caballi]